MSSELREHLADASFFEVVRRLQAKRDADTVPIGHRGPPAREAVRLRPALDLAFGASDLADCSGDATTGPIELTTRFLGLYGTSSPLPACYTELLLYDDPTSPQTWLQVAADWANAGELEESVTLACNALHLSGNGPPEAAMETLSLLLELYEALHWPWHHHIVEQEQAARANRRVPLRRRGR